MTSFIKPHCVSVHIVRQTSDGPRYLLIRRCGKTLTGTWQMVTGGIEKGETAPQAAFREIQEETGLVPASLYSADTVETFYMATIDQITFVPVFVAFVQDHNVTLSPTEHDAQEWLPFEKAHERLAWSEQRRALEHIHHRFVLKTPDPLLLLTPPPLSRTGVYGIALQNNKLLVVKQKKGPFSGQYDLPGGRIEAGETIEEALRREFREEVGLAFDSLQPIGNGSATTPIIQNGAPTSLHQTGLFYQISGLAPLAHSPELESFWIDLEELPTLPIAPLLHQSLSLLNK